MKRVVLIVVAVASVGAAVAWFWPWNRGPEQLHLPGTVEVQEVRLGSKVGGRVAAVHVKEGQLVEARQVVVTFEAPELSARRDQAQARLDVARANLEKANRGPRPEEIAEARAGAEAARTRFAKMRAGFRDEEKERARFDLDTALAEERQADEELGRMQQLYGAAAGGRAEYLNAIAARDRARGRAGSARAMLTMMHRGNRAEDIAESEAEAAKADAHFELLRRGTREEDKAAAYAAVTEAEGVLAESEANLREATVIAPERCVVEVLAVRPGDVVPAGQPVARILRADDLWVKVFVPSTELGKLKLNQAVEVAVDSHPGRRFKGEVVQIASVSEFTPRNVQSADERQHQVFAVKVRVADPEGIFKSGMAAEVFLTPSN